MNRNASRDITIRKIIIMIKSIVFFVIVLFCNFALAQSDPSQTLIVGQDGSPQWIIKCKQDFADCLQLSGAACSDGYDIISRSDPVTIQSKASTGTSNNNVDAELSDNNSAVDISAIEKLQGNSKTIVESGSHDSSLIIKCHEVIITTQKHSNRHWTSLRTLGVIAGGITTLVGAAIIDGSSYTNQTCDVYGSCQQQTLTNNNELATGAVVGISGIALVFISIFIPNDKDDRVSIAALHIDSPLNMKHNVQGTELKLTW